MNRLATLLLLTISSMAFSQGINFTDDAWNTLSKRAKEEGKFIFVEVYTDWCRACKYVEKEVFTNPEVAKLYNEKFISFKANAELGVGQLIAQNYDVDRYPTFLYFDTDGQLVLKSPGSKDAKGMIEEAHVAADPAPYNRYKLFKRKFNNTSVDKNVIEEYMILTRRFKKPTDTIFHAYYETLDILDKQDEEKLSIIAEYVPDAESRAFDQARDYYLRMRKDSATERTEAIGQNLINALDKSLKLRCPQGNEEQLSEILNKKDFVLTEMNPKDTLGNIRTLELDRIRFFACGEHKEKYAAAAAGFVGAFILSDERLHQDSTIEKDLAYVAKDLEDGNLLGEFAEKYLEYYKDKDRLSAANMWITQAIAWNNNYDHYRIKALIENALGEKSKAMRTARRGLENARKYKSPYAKELEMTLMEIVDGKRPETPQFNRPEDK